MRHAVKPLTLACSATLTAALVAASAPTAAAELRNYVGVVAGVAGGTGPFACATSGPTIFDGWFGGISLPTEGFAGCHLAGSISDQTAAQGTLSASLNTSAPVELGTATVQASAHTTYGRLGVAASGTMTGGTSAFTYHQASGFARFEDQLTLTAPGVATGTAGAVNFAFLVDGLMSSSPHPPYTQQADVGLGLRVNHRGGIFNTFMGTVINSNMPFVRGGSTGLPGSFVLGPGSLSGSANVLSTANFDFQWGVPFTVEAALWAAAYPCCYGASVNVDFSNTAVLSAITATAGGVGLTNFSVASASGTAYGPGGLLPVPEPSTALLWLGGLLSLGAWGRWRQRHQ